VLSEMLSLYSFTLMPIAGKQTCMQGQTEEMHESWLSTDRTRSQTANWMVRFFTCRLHIVNVIIVFFLNGLVASTVALAVITSSQFVFDPVPFLILNCSVECRPPVEVLLAAACMTFLSCEDLA